MKVSLKKIAAALNTTLPRSGDISTVIDGHRIWIGLGATWARRRKFQSVRIFPLRGTRAAALETVTLGRRIAAATGTDVTVEAGRMLITITSAGRLERPVARHITRPLKSIP